MCDQKISYLSQRWKEIFEYEVQNELKSKMSYSSD